jgi:ComF family protein
MAPACAACGALLDRPSRGAVCDTCWASILPITPPFCDRCGDPLGGWRRTVDRLCLCPRCRRVNRPIDRARTIGAYDGALRSIVHALKYDARRSLAKPLGRMMRLHGGELLDGAACVVPVPLHASRRRQRGFNQAADLAAQLGLPVVHALERARRTRTQTELPAAQRHRNVRGAFVPTRRCRALAGATVVLVDDVTTTGATLDACARTLQAAGVGEVRALTAARALGRTTQADNRD